jgi:hypothetical protein
MWQISKNVLVAVGSKFGQSGPDAHAASEKYAYIIR